MARSSLNADGAAALTDALLDVGDGRPQARDRLFPLVLDALRRIARSRLVSDRPERTLGATALVHDVYLSMVDQSRVRPRNRAHFFATASLAMRRILVDDARARSTPRLLPRPGGATDVVWDEDADRILALDAALERLGAFNPRGADIVMCRYFGGLDLGETSEALGIAPLAVRRGWDAARAWLRRELEDEAAS
jgi:RNA polymerase sigma factor (TIGR02999 family)